MKRVWVVGGSSGIGLELVNQLLEKDHFVVVSARQAKQTPELISLKKHYPEQVKLLNIDVSQPEGLEVKIHQAWCFFGGLDVWFYNAGAYHPMSLKEADIQQFKLMNDVNYLGCAYLMNYFFQYLYKEQEGHKMKWVWNASLASQFGLPYGGGYSAPKAALVNLAESVQPELAKQGIDLRIINHGFVKTRLTEKNQFTMPGLMDAKKAAGKIVDFIEYGNGFEFTFPFGLTRFLKLLKFLPYRLSLAMSKRLLKHEDN